MSQWATISQQPTIGPFDAHTEALLWENHGVTPAFFYLTQEELEHEEESLTDLMDARQWADEDEAGL